MSSRLRGIPSGVCVWDPSRVWTGGQAGPRACSCPLDTYLCVCHLTAGHSLYFPFTHPFPPPSSRVILGGGSEGARCRPPCLPSPPVVVPTHRVERWAEDDGRGSEKVLHCKLSTPPRPSAHLLIAVQDVLWAGRLSFALHGSLPVTTLTRPLGAPPALSSCPSNSVTSREWSSQAAQPA